MRGCNFVFASGIICGLTFKKEKQFVRHGQSKSHGGPGARAAFATKKEVEKSKGKNTKIDSNLEVEQKASPEAVSTKKEVRKREGKNKRIESNLGVEQKASPEAASTKKDVRKRSKLAVGQWDRLRKARRKGGPTKGASCQGTKEAYLEDGLPSPEEAQSQQGGVSV